MQDKLWQFIDAKGTFSSEKAQEIRTLYLPLCNSYPFMSSLTPDLHGDAKTSNNAFLLEPVSRLDLSNSKSSRNFWIRISPDKIWSATGVSKDLAALKNDRLSLEAGLLWQKVIRKNTKIGLEAQVSSFVPASGEPVEIMLVTLTNIAGTMLRLTPTCAIPLYCRSANSLRDHRQVTSLLNRTQLHPYGIIVTPTLIFDESGHTFNRTTYFVFGIDEDARAPEYIYPTREAFCGESGDLEAPEAIYKNLLPEKNSLVQGKEALAGLRFPELKLPPGSSHSYITLMGTAARKDYAQAYFEKFNRPRKVKIALEKTRDYWQGISGRIQVKSDNPAYDNWFRWVSIQPTLRKIFGCSFLPDFDYGKGGRGWRDLWQDCLSLILTNPDEVRPLLENNFSGVRIDGSNATIIGQEPGEFIADRNNISRVWMDHGVWPLVTTLLYIHQTGDSDILLEKCGYFRDHQLSRSRVKDEKWSLASGDTLKSKDGKTYRGTILEHLLVENLVQFFNVGPHNLTRLEDADWNDGLDMAHEFGESVAFACMYAKNLDSLCELLVKLKQHKILVFKELLMLLDSLTGNRLDYNSVSAKQKLLEEYFSCVQFHFSGKNVPVSREKLIADLVRKSEWLSAHIHKNEWLKCGFFNGYYNNRRQKVEGNTHGSMRMTLTGQVFPVMSGIATNEQIRSIYKQACNYLKDNRFGGFRLNTDFGKEQPDLGRAFSFSYGEKENGAFFSHMSVMFAYGLYARGFAREGFEVLNSISQMALDTKTSKIYPCLPEYFNGEGRGMYSYLTGSASWYIFTVLTQGYGVCGEYGDLVIEPKLTAGEFKQGKAAITCPFAQKNLEVIYQNPQSKDYGNYRILEISLNQKIIASGINNTRYLIPRKNFLSLAKQKTNLLEVVLG